MKTKSKEKCPQAWVVSSNDRGRKKVYKNNKVFLNNGEEFEIEIHNPTKNNVLSSIKLDGKLISDTGLIVRPGERIYLDCFIDNNSNNKKFVFKTYEVEDTDESKKAISSNGKLEVSFYKEDIIGEIDLTSLIGSKPVQDWRINPWVNPWVNPWIDPYRWNINNSIIGSGSIDLKNTNGWDNYLSTPTTTTNINSNIETGQVSKGDISKQKFREVDMDFEDKVLSSIKYKLLPESRKPKTKKDINPLKKVSEKIHSKSNSFEDLYINLQNFKNLNNDGVLSSQEFDIIRKGVVDKMISLLESSKIRDAEDLYSHLNYIGNLKNENIIDDKEFIKMKGVLIVSFA